MTLDPRTSPSLTALLRAVVAISLLAVCASAEAQISRPGAHDRYGVEVDPHLVIQWHKEPVCGDEGLGLGGRLSFPVMDDGPIPTINNSLAIGVGADFSFFDGECYLNWQGVRGRYDDGSGTSLWVPVDVQWNLFFAKSFSAFMELGLAVNHQTAEWCAGGVCDDRGDTDVDLVLWFGGRVHINPSVAFIFRLGTPSLQLGASFFL